MLITYIHFGLVSGSILWMYDWHRKHYLMILTLMIIAALLAFSRSLSGLFISIALFVAIYSNFENKLNVLVPKVMLSMSILFVIITVFFSFVHFRSVKGDMVNIFKLYSWSIDDRYYMNMAAFEMCIHNPVFGSGPGNYTFTSKEYLALLKNDKQDDRQVNALALRKLDPHNSYFGLLAENGIIGFISFSALFYYLLVVRNRKNKNILSETEYMSYLIIRGGLIGLLVSGIFMDILSLRHLWVLLGMSYSFSGFDKS